MVGAQAFRTRAQTDYAGGGVSRAEHAEGRTSSIPIKKGICICRKAQSY